MGWNGPMTERQYTAWQAWLREEYNNPSRADYYAMQGPVKEAKPIVFAEPMSDAEQLETAKQRAIIRGGGQVIRRKVDKDGNDCTGS